MNNNLFLETVFQKEIHPNIVIIHSENIQGGCIHNAMKVETNEGNFFIKFNQAGSLDMFQKECLGLERLGNTNTINTPIPVNSGELDSKSYLILPYIESGRVKPDFWQEFGNGLATLHKNHISNTFGLDHNNYIGRLNQINEEKKSWIDFFIEMRLEKQLLLAHNNRLVDLSFVKRFQRLYPRLANLLPEEPASLLHGDLWSGNFMVGRSGEPVIIDPAIYYGNREIELAFTIMFGGFDKLFYQAYNASFPLQPGFENRALIYNIYPSLVHANLFGASYLHSINNVLNMYL